MTGGWFRIPLSFYAPRLEIYYAAYSLYFSNFLWWGVLNHSTSD